MSNIDFTLLQTGNHTFYNLPDTLQTRSDSLRRDGTAFQIGILIAHIRFAIAG